MNLIDELQKLEQLYQNGSLTVSEFAQAKSTLLNTKNVQNPTVNSLSHEAFLEKETLLARLDREQELEKQKYMVQGKYGSTHLPSTTGGIAGALIIGAFGAFWTVMAFGITSQVPNVEPFNIVKIMFPLFGVVFTFGGIWMGLNQYQKAGEYRSAFKNYQLQRDQILNS